MFSGSQKYSIICLESSTTYKIKLRFKDFNYTFFDSDESTMLSRYSELGKISEKLLLNC